MATEIADERPVTWILECRLKGEWRELSRHDDEAIAVQVAIDMGMPPGELGQLLRVRRIP